MLNHPRWWMQIPRVVCVQTNDQSMFGIHWCSVVCHCRLRIQAAFLQLSFFGAHSACVQNSSAVPVSTEYIFQCLNWYLYTVQSFVRAHGLRSTYAALFVDLGKYVSTVLNTWFQAYASMNSNMGCCIVRYARSAVIV